MILPNRSDYAALNREVPGKMTHPASKYMAVVMALFNALVDISRPQGRGHGAKLYRSPIRNYGIFTTFQKVKVHENSRASSRPILTAFDII